MTKMFKVFATIVIIFFKYGDSQVLEWARIDVRALEQAFQRAFVAEHIDLIDYQWTESSNRDDSFLLPINSSIPKRVKGRFSLKEVSIVERWSEPKD